MSKIVWDKIGERFYETGVSKGVLYPAVGGAYPKGVAWNGLTGVSENPSGAEATPLYAGDIKYLNLMSAEEFAATIEAYTYPKEFAACDGSVSLTEGVVIGQQTRQQFGFSYQTRIGNDTDGSDHGYKIHIVYGCLASPSEKSYQTINDSPEAMTLSWEISTTPVEIEGHKPTATITVSSVDVDQTKLKKLEDELYGTKEKEAHLPTPAEIAAIFSAV
nr:MAG TPA_asm: tail tube protein [Caudoviricetes sp.]